VLEVQAQAHHERERRELLEQLALASYQRAQSEKLALLGRLAANVMHELNNPLAFVRSNLSFLQQEVLARLHADTADLQEAFDETQHGLERLREIASDLRGFSRLDEGEPSRCALAEVVEDASRIARLRLKHVALLQVQVPEDLPEIHASPRKLAQVLVNLLVNAGDALEEAGTKHAAVSVRGWSQGEHVVLSVEDNGPGFPPSVLEHLFQPFFTTKGAEKGTGLGLALSREMVERYGGSLVAENRLEGGACLRLTLRALPRAASAA
jgi:C4-dicarboxylate-specific signal transduction histidine kinase